MNPVLAFLVLLGAVALWFALVKIGDYLDEKFKR